MNAVRQDPAPAVSQGLFKGIAVVIDDNIVIGSNSGPDGASNAPRGEPDGIEAIIKAIEDAGAYAVKLTELPTREEALDNFANAAFFVMDWNLHGAKLVANDGAGQDGDDRSAPILGVDLGGLGKAHESENIEFLENLRKRRHAPVFIFTNDDVAHVTEVLTEAGLIEEDSDSHIMVKSKRQIGANLYGVLDEWIKQTPSALILKEWERNQAQAINHLFSEFHDRNKYWPVIFWNGFKEDGVPPAPELGELITRLVTARMKPLSANLDEFSTKAIEHFGANGDRYKKALHEVLQAERLLPAELLDPTKFSTGDLFYDPNNGSPRYLLNVRPACDCVKRNSGFDNNLHLIKGTILTEEKLLELAQHDHGNFQETDVESIVFALHEGKTIVFKFRSLFVEKFARMPGARVGRMLAPFLTRVTQRYAAFSHRSGLPRVPAALMPARPQPGPPNDPAANQD
ncbi:hypothetical protein [Stenotrophomonas indicatrix]|uniref:hypothetical protein n=1 Tax=Stenotrophomonas indicatrix TaxID=2045451 RepID=UPI00320AE37B